MDNLTYKIGLVYLCGPMRGMADMNVPTFMDAANVLESFGLSVVSPAHSLQSTRFYRDVVNGACTTEISDYVYRSVLARDIVVLASCDTLCTLDGWKSSDGARVEVEFALRTKIPVYHFDDLVQMMSEALTG